jgi:hypothetical protein
MTSQKGMTQHKSPMELALQYAARGWPVLPLYSIRITPEARPAWHVRLAKMRHSREPELQNLPKIRGAQ